MSDKSLPSFKAGAKQASGVRPGAKAATKSASKDEPAAPAPTLGFQRIEEILDREQPKELQQELGALADSLDELVAKAPAAKDKGNAKRAKLAVVRTVELLAMLFHTKHEMLNEYVRHKEKGEASKATGKPKQAPNKGKGAR